MAYVLFTLFVFSYSGVQHICDFVLFVFILCTIDRCVCQVRTDNIYLIDFSHLFSGDKEQICYPFYMFPWQPQAFCSSKIFYIFKTKWNNFFRLKWLPLMLINCEYMYIHAFSTLCCVGKFFFSLKGEVILSRARSEG
jgi:hypothetical protein